MWLSLTTGSMGRVQCVREAQGYKYSHLSHAHRDRQRNRYTAHWQYIDTPSMTHITQSHPRPNTHMQVVWKMHIPLSHISHIQYIE
jgi:hypothetical protein